MNCNFMSNNGFSACRLRAQRALGHKPGLKEGLVPSMPHFYFHVVNGHGETRDEEGVELPDLEAARHQALSGIRSILREELARGYLDFGGRIHITDDDDRTLLEVPFRTAVDVRDGPS
jgi:hypothetical protein